MCAMMFWFHNAADFELPYLLAGMIQYNYDVVLYFPHKIEVLLLVVLQLKMNRFELFTPLEPQSRFGDKVLEIRVECPQNGSAVLKRLRRCSGPLFIDSCLKSLLNDTPYRYASPCASRVRTQTTERRHSSSVTSFTASTLLIDDHEHHICGCGPEASVEKEKTYIHTSSTEAQPF